MIVVKPIASFTDNYIWILIQGKHAVVVDPGQAEPVLDYLSAHDLQLTGILITHHHHDHVGGVAALVAHTGVPVYGPQNPNLTVISHPVGASDRIDLTALGLSLEVLEVPGHTLDHIAFAGRANVTEMWLFCGDCLFSCGCGRLFEGDSRQMLQSLDKFKKMPENTIVYCAHEYTLSNLKWARVVDPDNTDLQNRQQMATALRGQQLPTVPTLMSNELRTNPFLRVDDLAIRRAAEAFAGHPLETPEQVFGVLREWKNTF